MTQAPLEGVRACVFDAYGTLFDFAAAAKGCRDLLGDDIDRLTGLWREKQLQYTWLRAVQDRHEDFWQVTGDALDFALETLGYRKAGPARAADDALSDARCVSGGAHSAHAPQAGRPADGDFVEWLTEND